jgi:hypothetical protein
MLNKAFEYPDAASMHPIARRALREGVRLSLLLAAAGILALGFLWLPETATTQGEFIIGELLAVAVGLQLLVAAYLIEQPLANSARLIVLRVRRDG